MASNDKYNRKDYSAFVFGVVLVLVAAYVILKELKVI
jgi:hypothetical protein